MFSRYRKNNLAYGIIGLGRFGYALAKELAELDADVMVLEKDESKVREIREHIENALAIRNLDKNSLLETGIQNCDIAIVCIGDQMDSSILTTLNLVSFGIPKVIARASSEEHGQILEKLGAEVVYPESDMAVRLANRLESSDILDFAQLNEYINISKIAVSSDMEDETVEHVNLENRFGIKLIAIETDGEVRINIRPDYVFEEDDIIYVMGDRENLEELAEWIDDD